MVLMSGRMTLLSQPRYRWDERPSNSGVGIYAYFIDRPNGLRPISLPANGLLYIGMTDSSLDARCHFEHGHSGFSTFRRSLGALLKSQLQLRALPRSYGASRSNVLNYRFEADDEDRLTNWMRENLTYSYRDIADHVAAAEKAEIMEESPPLNLIGWKNESRAEIKRLRALCAAEASLARTIR